MKDIGFNLAETQQKINKCLERLKSLQDTPVIFFKGASIEGRYAAKNNVIKWQTLICEKKDDKLFSQVLNALEKTLSVSRSVHIISEPVGSMSKSPTRDFRYIFHLYRMAIAPMGIGLNTGAIKLKGDLSVHLANMALKFVEFDEVSGKNFEEAKALLVKAISHHKASPFKEDANLFPGDEHLTDLMEMATQNYLLQSQEYCTKGAGIYHKEVEELTSRYKIAVLAQVAFTSLIAKTPGGSKALAISSELMPIAEGVIPEIKSFSLEEMKNAQVTETNSKLLHRYRQIFDEKMIGNSTSVQMGDFSKEEKIKTCTRTIESLSEELDRTWVTSPPLYQTKVYAK